MKISKQEIIREAVELIGAAATNNQIRNYGKQKYEVELAANDIWATCGSEKQRRFNDVTYTELKQIEKDSQKYGGLTRLIQVANCADSMAKAIKK
jgi:hypothetical protein